MGLKGEKGEDKIQRKPLTNAWKHERKDLSGKFKEFGIVDTTTVPGPGGVLNINDVTDHGTSTLRFAAFEMLYF